VSEPILPARIEYGRQPFDLAHLSPEPLQLFQEWFSEAIASGQHEVNGVCLCTNDPEEGPDGRIVLLKGYGEAGFSFFTNFESDKGHQLAADPRACLVFWWQPLRRQVRIRGAVERVPEGESEAYFESRPRDSQLGAWASEQSRPVSSRSDLEQRLTQVAARFPETVPRPPHWGGYRLVPSRIEFWQGRDSRLHDRFIYLRGHDGSWTARRLMP
jgi:pyridoxamine 5'-phosphate oxidase